MVARINTSKNVLNALNYNEQKVRQGKAVCILANNFLKGTDQLHFYEKLRHFQKFNTLNERTKTNTLHLSLNFDPSEKLSDEKLKEIAKTYMDRIGFGKQPYLVYRHEDAGHPHIHIVSTNIQADGSRISMHNLGRNQSEKARKEIEIEFGLVEADDKKRHDFNTLHPVNAKKIAYGKSETRQAIANVLNAVITHYKFTSLTELNAILKLYNVTAERGQEHSRMYNHSGLIYHALDDNGNKTGKGIKASSFFLKPTLSLLEKKFVENETLRRIHKKRTSTTIDWAVLKKPKNIHQLSAALEKEGITLVVRTNKEGQIYGLTYVDHTTQSVFNGSDLGKQYSAVGIQERLGQDATTTENKSLRTKQQIDQPYDKKREVSWKQPTEGTLLEVLLSPTHENNYTPFDLVPRKKKKKKKRISI
jgi:hypothetical protein